MNLQAELAESITFLISFAGFLNVDASKNTREDGCGMASYIQATPYLRHRKTLDIIEMVF